MGGLLLEATLILVESSIHILSDEYIFHLIDGGPSLALSGELMIHD